MEPKFYLVEYGSEKKLYVAAGSKKALQEFNSMYFKYDGVIEVKEVDKQEVSQTPYFADFEKCRKMRRNDSFCLGSANKNN